jgi:hypothetical protein
MRHSLVSIIIVSYLLTACGTQPSKPITTQPSSDVNSANQPASAQVAQATNTPPSDTTAVLTPISPTKTLLALTPTEASTPARWFWAIPNGKDQILAFNSTGQVNTILDLTGIQHKGFEPLIRLGDDRAIAFFANNDKPKAFLLTSNVATPIKLPNVQVPIPGNGWQVLAQQGAYIVIAPSGTVTTPAILINGENGQASLLASNIYGPTAINYFVRFSADGQSLRYATGQEPVEVHNRDLKSGTETTFYHSSSYVSTDSFGEIWNDYAIGTAVTAKGQPIKLKNTDDKTKNILLANGWILETKFDCAAPCTLQAYPSAGEAAALKYSLPVKLVFQTVMIGAVQPLDQNSLLVSVQDANAADMLPALWLLTPDGKSELLGKGLSLNQFTPYYRISGLSDDNRYILLYPADGTPAFSIYDLSAGKELFSETLDNPGAFLEVMYFPEGIIVHEQGDNNHHWVYNYATGTAAEVQPPAGAGYCTAFTAIGQPVCMTDSNVVVYNPGSGQATPLVPEPVASLSN